MSSNLQKKSTRDEFFKQRTKIPRTTDPRRRMYIDEDLTEFRQKLLFDARQKVKCGKIRGAWCQHGNIMVLKLEGGPTCIKDYNDLGTLTYLGYRYNLQAATMMMSEQVELPVTLAAISLSQIMIATSLICKLFVHCIMCNKNLKDYEEKRLRVQRLKSNCSLK